MSEENSAAESAGEDKEPADKPAEPRKELEGFQVTRSAPPAAQEGNPMIVPIIVVLLLLVGGGIAATQLGGGGDDATDGAATTGASAQEDEEVPDYVWDRLEFLEGEGNFDKALEVAEEAQELTPNSKLLMKIQGYKKELGLDLEELTLEAALAKARKALINGRAQEALDAATAAIDRSEGENAEAFVLRGQAAGRMGDKAAAVEDLETALELGYEPADKVEAILKQYEE